MLDRYRQNLQSRAAALAVTLDRRLPRLMQYWLLIGGLICAARLSSGSRWQGAPVSRLMLPTFC